MKRIVGLAAGLALAGAVDGQDSGRRVWDYLEWSVYSRPEKMAYLYGALDLWKIVYNMTSEFQTIEEYRDFVYRIWQQGVEGRSTSLLLAYIDDFYMMKKEERDKPVIYPLFAPK